MNGSPPTSSRWLMDGFCWYARRMVRRHFHIFGVDDEGLADRDSLAPYPLIVYSNHPGWWDPIVGMLLCRTYFGDRRYFAPIDAEALEKYAVFKRLGYFGVSSNSSGIMQFLRQAEWVLRQPDGSLWITPEGEFVDVRRLDPPFMPGLAHLAFKVPNARCVPVAIEYAFSDERLPLILCKFGRPLTAHAREENTKEDWSIRLEHSLRQVQRELAEAIIHRRWSSFRPLLRAAHGPRGVYDWMRWFAARVRGKRFEWEHGDSFRRVEP